MSRSVRMSFIKRFEEDMEVVEESDIYSESGRDELLESEMIDPVEEGFMRGYEENDENVV